MGIFCQGILKWSERDLKNHGIAAYCYYSFPQVYLLSMLGSQKPKTNRNHCNILLNYFTNLVYGVTIFLELGRVNIKYD